MIGPRVFPPLVLCVLASMLAGCTTTAAKGGVVTLDGLRAFVVAESGYDAAVETADLAAKSGTLSASTAARIMALADTGHTCVVAGRAAVKAADARDLASETSALTTLAGQLAALSRKTDK